MLVSIMGRDYTVAIKRLPKRIYGKCSYKHKEIFLNSRYPDNYHDTLLHEIVHAILYESGLTNLTGYAENEAIVMAIEHGLVQSGLIHTPQEWEDFYGGA